VIVRRVLGLALGLLAWVWLRTLRVSVLEPEGLRRASGPLVLVFFHGTQFPLLAWRRPGPTSVLVSLSKDGEMQSRALGLLGFRVLRGSSSRAGAMGLRGLLRTQRQGHDVAMAVDGPRGPRGQAKGGALTLARATGAALVPMGAFAKCALVFGETWDQFSLPLPFSRVFVVVGEPLCDARQLDEPALTLAISEANARAAAWCKGKGREVSHPNAGGVGTPSGTLG
jgi:lysophospholipid acyltransferase (LPLAT)-like uncharacterized protein